MRSTIVLVTALVLTFAVTAAEARESSRGRIHPDRRGDSGLRFRGDRSYTTPGTEFQNDLRGYGGIHDDYRYQRSYGTPWWAVPENPFANSFARGVYPRYNHNRYNYRPGISLQYNNGDWNANFYSNDDCRTYPTQYGIGYGNDCYGQSYNGYYDPVDYYDNRQAAEQPQQVYNDNRVYNYTFNGEGQPGAAAQPRASAPAPSKLPQSAPNYSAFGRQFKEELRLAMPGGNYVFAIRKGVLYAGLEDGKAAKIASGVDSHFGGYAVWMPGSGVSVIYQREGSLNAAYRLKDGWHLAALGHKLDTRKDTTIGMVGGQPWLVFTGTNGTRYVVSFDGQAWQEVGSGTSVRK
jgi:hypothetical protein